MKAINCKLPDHSHALLRRLATDSGRTSAKVIELALLSLERETSKPSTKLQAVRSAATVVSDVLLDPNDAEALQQKLPAGSGGVPEGNDGAASALADLPPSEPADLSEVLEVYTSPAPSSPNPEDPNAETDPDEALLSFLEGFE